MHKALVYMDSLLRIQLLTKVMNLVHTLTYCSIDMLVHMNLQHQDLK